MKAKFAFLGIFAASLAFAHFGVLTTDKNVVEDQKDATLKLNLEFSHPFLQESMNLQKPAEFSVFIDGEKKSLLGSLKEQKKGENSYFTAEFKADKPSLLAFYFDPKPYAEPAEQKMIRHITKTYVDAYGAGEGWDKPLGLEAEIVPLVRPYALYAGEIFSGVFLLHGKPVPGADVEIELYNDKGYKAPSEAHVTQVVKTNGAGEFSFVMPVAGWWGFAALSEEEAAKGSEQPINELGAVLWIKADELKK